MRTVTSFLLGSVFLSGLPAWPHATAAQAQDSATVANITKAALAVRDSLKTSKAFQVGLGIGVRVITSSNDLTVRNATINPQDSTVAVDGIDKKDVVLSGVVTIFPWQHRQSHNPKGRNYIRCSICRSFGFVANVNLAAFSPDNVAVFNRSIEGGLGLAIRLADTFAFAATYERVFSRRLRGFVKPGERLVVDGKVLTELDPADSRFFVDDNLTALSFKYIYYF